MALELLEQFEKILSDSKKVLILIPENPSGDAIGSAWAFYFYLEKRGIEGMIILSNNLKETEKYNFLARPKNICDRFTGGRDFILLFNTKFNKITNVRTEKNDDELRIYITPDHGSIDPRDFSFTPAKFKYDSVVVLNSPDKETLGKLLEENPDIFYELPVINIDNHANNDNFGQVNLVEMTASSTAEILAGIFEKSDPDILDDKIANCLLTGIISATESFQNSKTTPNALQTAAKLIDCGANQQEIVRYLYKNQPLQLLKLWGRIMARLKWNEELRLVWAPIYIEDFVQSRSNPQDISQVLDKIQDNYSAGKMFLVVYNETPILIKAVLKFSDAEYVKKLVSLGKGKIKGNTYEFEIESGNIDEAEEKIIEKLKTKGDKN
jgi:nanoRNase/pAp phosphatase (c-di-AMP/oligoRNAs hydrolase)